MHKLRLCSWQVILAGFVLASPALALISERPQVLKDSTGRIIGTVEGFSATDSTSAHLVVRVNGHLGRLTVLQNGRMQGDISEVMFTGTTCTGTPYAFFNAGKPIHDFTAITGVYPALRFFYGSGGTAPLQSPGTAQRELVFNSAACNTISLDLTGAAVQLTEDTTAAAELNALAQPFSVVSDETGQGVYTPVAPCRAVDTRTGDGGLMSPNINRKFDLAGVCGIPTYQGGAPFVQAVLVNVTVLSPSADGFLTIWPGDKVVPASSTLNFTTGQTVANSATVGMAQDSTQGNDVAVRVGFASAHVVIDVVGYYTQ